MRDRNIVITGGTGGLGRAVTKAIVERGAQVTIPVFDEREVDALAEVLGDAIKQVHTVKADLRDESDVAKLFDDLPRVEGLVHLVGGFAAGDLHTAELSTLDKLVALNVTTTFLALKHAVRRMRDGGYGRIVTVGSKNALQPGAGMSLYGATKAAVVSMTQAVAEECVGTNITANSVLPSIIDTPANRKSMGDDQAPQWVTPSHLAETIAFLMSEAAGDLRGTAVRVYGNVP